MGAIRGPSWPAPLFPGADVLSCHWQSEAPHPPPACAQQGSHTTDGGQEWVLTLDTSDPQYRQL